MSLINTDIVRLKMRIPGELVGIIEQVEDYYHHLPAVARNEKIAVFDLDNTLLVGDIGEAVFVQLKIDEETRPLTVTGEPMPFTWQEYEALMRENNRYEAFKRMVSAMADIPANLVVEVTRRVMHSRQSFLEAEGAKVPVPYANPIMQALVSYLTFLNYSIYIVSASSQWSVQYIAAEYFNVPPSRVVAMRNKLLTLAEGSEEDPILSAELEEPLTVGDGKAAAYKKHISTLPPLITAGDSTSDLPILSLTAKKGLIIWVGETDRQLGWLKHSTPGQENIYFLKR